MPDKPMTLEEAREVIPNIYHLKLSERARLLALLDALAAEVERLRGAVEVMEDALRRVESPCAYTVANTMREIGYSQWIQSPMQTNEVRVEAVRGSTIASRSGEVTFICGSFATGTNVAIPWSWEGSDDEVDAATAALIHEAEEDFRLGRDLSDEDVR